MALYQLFQLYKKTLRIHLLWKVLLQAFSSKELYELRYNVLFSVLYRKITLKFIYQIKLVFYKLFIPNKILIMCPCSEPKCPKNKLGLTESKV